MEERILSITFGDLVEDHRDVVPLGQIDEITSRSQEDDVVCVLLDLVVGQDWFDGETRVGSQDDTSMASAYVFHVDPILEVIIVGDIDVRQRTSIDL